MNSRISEMAKDVMEGKVWYNVTAIEYDRCDLFLEPLEMQAKRSYEYIVGQKPQISENAAFGGHFRFQGDVHGEMFQRVGHENFHKAMDAFYNTPVNNLCTFEWQHSVGNFKKIIDIGIDGVKEEIKESKLTHKDDSEKTAFLNGVDKICDAIIEWANKNADYALKEASKTENPEYKNNLIRISKTLRKIPQKPAESFYEAVQCIFICYQFLSDSIGLIDRHLYEFYIADIKSGKLTPEDAKSYLQELFLMLQARIHIKSDRFYRGGESHFCIGGYLEDGTDGFSELSKLILESLLELPTCIPQISVRITGKTPHDVMRFVMDCERRDPNKRIAFVNDEPRLKALTEIAGFDYKTAINYTMTGCNEPCMTGGRILGASQQNLLRSMANTFKNRAEEIKKAKSFDDFYKIYEEELFSDLDEMLEIDDAFNRIMSRDTNLVSAIFLDGCVKTGLSPTNGGAVIGTSTMDVIGLTSVIDSLAIVRQFIFSEKRVTMNELVDAVNSNWQGYEDLHTEILKCGKFFGNDDDETNEVAQRLTSSIHEFLKDKKSFFGKRFIVGNLIGYNQHNKWFGELTSATPDGRYDGDSMSFGIGQSEGKDRNGISALLNSVAKYDMNGIMTGPSVTNVAIDDKMITDEAFFEKMVMLFEAYFKAGGTHFQLNYTSASELKSAKANPQNYKNLRVRVSGFSDFFVNLNDDLQDEIIVRTVKSGI